MLLRIALIIGVAAGLGALGLSFQVGERIQTLTQERNDARDTANRLRAENTQLQGELDKAEEELTSVKEELASTEKKLNRFIAETEQQKKLIAELRNDLDATTKKLNSARDELARWDTLGLTIDEALALRDNLRQVREERQVLQKENQLLERRITVLENRLEYFVGEEQTVTLPSNLSGKVTSVNNDLGFVIVNLGSEDGVLERGMLAVARNGELVGRIRITKSIKPNQSVANILSGWGGDQQIQVGDRVYTSYEAVSQN